MTTDRQVLVDGEALEPDAGWSLAWIDPSRGVALLRRGTERSLVTIEGGPAQWVVVHRGRRIPVTVQGHRERLLAEAAETGSRHHGPAEIRASLPGRVARVLVEPGTEVEAGDPLVTIEAVKMQNEIRAPRAGRVLEVLVGPGEAIAGGTLLVRLAELDP
jgi:biotin carboxyl carrier protein